MSDERCDAPILRHIGASLRKIYGDRIEGLVLFGSRARGVAPLRRSSATGPPRALTLDPSRILLL
jgi:hypothetical protein